MSIHIYIYVFAPARRAPRPLPTVQGRRGEPLAGKPATRGPEAAETMNII